MDISNHYNRGIPILATSNILRPYDLFCPESVERLAQFKHIILFILPYTKNYHTIILSYVALS